MIADYAVLVAIIALCVWWIHVGLNGTDLHA